MYGAFALFWTFLLVQAVFPPEEDAEFNWPFFPIWLVVEILLVVAFLRGRRSARSGDTA